jgi:uncharacterized protein with von Willebrand factor type A (vWA) domain
MHRARYSAWNGDWSGTALDPEQVLDSLSDEILANGIEPALNRALHQGIANTETGHLPGIDAVLSQVRADMKQVMSDLLEETDADLLADSASSAGDEDLRKMAQALRAQAPAFPGMVAGASDETRADLEGLVAAGAPGTEPQEIHDVLDHLVDLARLEQQMRHVRSVDDVLDIDREMLARLLGEHVAETLSSLMQSLLEFAESGYVSGQGSKAKLSARAVQQIGDTLLQTTLRHLESKQSGAHERRDLAHGHEHAGTSRDYQFGDTFDLDIGQTVIEAVKRRPGVPVQLEARDLKIIEREGSERATTILAIDLSRSMGERGYLLAARKLALALSTFIRRRFSQDELLIVGFSESARQINVQDLADLKWDRYGYGTNVHDALRLSGKILGTHRGRKRNLVLITDGEPTAHRDANGTVRFSHPPEPDTLALTYREAERLRRDGVYLCVCLLSSTEEVASFGRQLARYAAGDVIVTDPDNLTADLVVRYSQRR